MFWVISGNKPFKIERFPATHSAKGLAIPPSHSWNLLYKFKEFSQIKKWQHSPLQSGFGSQKKGNFPGKVLPMEGLDLMKFNSCSG
jgi:hypothetical protein